MNRNREFTGSQISPHPNMSAGENESPNATLKLHRSQLKELESTGGIIVKTFRKDGTEIQNSQITTKEKRPETREPKKAIRPFIEVYRSSRDPEK